MDIVHGRIRRPRTNALGLALVAGVALVAAACSGSNTFTELSTGEIFVDAPVGVPTTPPIPIPTVTPLPTAPVAAVPDLAAPGPTSTPPPTATTVPAPTAVPTATAVPEPPPPTATAQPEPTAVPPATAVAEPTLAPTPPPTATAAVVAAETAAVVASSPATDVGDRRVTNNGYQSLGVAEGVPLALPVARIELIGFHEASHPGAKGVNAASTGVAMITLDSRSRNTPARSAADIVVPPGEPVVAPATGTITAANHYILYCEHDDQLVYIEPDGLPGWQVRVFHVEGASPPVGTRVIAGETRIADSARALPFESQVDKFTGEPSWPHVHVEVVDTTVPDTRPPGPGCP